MSLVHFLSNSALEQYVTNFEAIGKSVQLKIPCVLVVRYHKQHSSSTHFASFYKYLCTCFSKNRARVTTSLQKVLVGIGRRGDTIGIGRRGTQCIYLTFEMAISVTVL